MADMNEPPVKRRYSSDDDTRQQPSKQRKVTRQVPPEIRTALGGLSAYIANTLPGGTSQPDWQELLKLIMLRIFPGRRFGDQELLRYSKKPQVQEALQEAWDSDQYDTVVCGEQPSKMCPPPLYSD